MLCHATRRLDNSKSVVLRWSWSWSTHLTRRLLPYRIQHTAVTVAARAAAIVRVVLAATVLVCHADHVGASVVVLLRLDSSSGVVVEEEGEGIGGSGVATVESVVVMTSISTSTRATPSSTTTQAADAAIQAAEQSSSAVSKQKNSARRSERASVPRTLQWSATSHSSTTRDETTGADA